ncbi:ArsR family transcriptional regulator [Biomaibacter acetigenes]|uniref:ArsR family transcriptional regulator n=1 Tax=Biomaibacter acetigenes TaxID=2316383 RepID=A0A3G2R8L7_9FIRM|nr:metalloregulator ArsR/SmtB family transcription factor [Biomaibacter acetigenes]AYO31725.1 ArsR family transcriptional regulator [Biomaibacter acetigenes]RKL62275.1 ArsR family transcriptional regulator [Thermoanaerobacteraceae bacterium SP2]
MDLIEIFKVLGDENRIRIFNLLTKGVFCVCRIETVLGMNQSNTSRHLNRLKSAGIITCEKKSQWVYYKINNKFIEENKLLYDFLKNKLAENPRCLEDIERLNNDAAIDLACDKLT